MLEAKFGDDPLPYKAKYILDFYCLFNAQC